MAAQCCRFALARLDADLAHELGAGYPKCTRFEELILGTAENVNERERALMVSYRELVAEANGILDAHNASVSDA